MFGKKKKSTETQRGKELAEKAKADAKAEKAKQKLEDRDLK